MVAALAACGEGLTGPPTGAIEVTSVTAGEPADPDGYAIAIDARQQPLGANTRLTVAGIAAGDHRLELLGIAPNCILAGGNPRTVTVTADAVLRITLAVSCFAGRGSIAVFTKTIGPDPDPDGYTVQLDGGSAQPIDMNALVTYPAVPAGNHALLLSAVAANCTVTGPNPRTIAVTIGADTWVTFGLACRSTGEGTLLFNSNRSGEQHVYRVEPDGSGLRDLTPHAPGGAADWSPDRARIVFESAQNGEAGVSVMNADGSSPVRLASGLTPVWSPDGRRIAFVGAGSVTVMNADGSDPIALTPGYAPAWSPDGTQIAFTRPGGCWADVCGVDLYVMRADGSAVRKLTPSATLPDSWQAPSWSPDGTRIGFTRECCFLFGDRRGVWTVDPSGGTPSLVYLGGVRGRPVWSPDGATLAFAAVQADGTTELMLMPSKGAAPDALASSPASEYPTSWR
jgi:hypothetical protein